MIRARTAVTVFARDFEMDLFIGEGFADIKDSTELLGIGERICVFFFVKACTFGVRKIMHRANFVILRFFRFGIIFIIAYYINARALLHD